MGRLLIKQKSNQMISIIKGKVFIDGVQTTNPELIGYALLDFIEEFEIKDFQLTLKEKTND